MDDIVLVQRRPDGVRTGRLLDRTDQGYLVSWDDEDAPRTLSAIPMSVAQVRVGTLRHRALVNPSALDAELGDAPAPLFAEFLRDQRRPVRAQELIKEFVAQTQFDRDRIAAAWKRAKPELNKHPNIDVSGRPPSYRWTDTPVDPFAALRSLPLAVVLERIAGPDTTDDERAIAAARIREDTDVGLALRVAAAGLGLVDYPAETELADALREPLELGRAISEMPDRALARVVDDASDRGRSDVLLTVSVCTRPAKPLARIAEHLASIEQQHVAALIDAAYPESLPPDPTNTRDIGREISVIVRRLAPLLTTASALRILLDVLARARRDNRAKDLSDAVLEQVAANTITDEDLDAAIGEVDIAAVLDAASRAPLRPGSGRSRLIAAAGRADAQAVAAPTTWRGVALQDLATVLAAGELTAVVGRRAVGDAVVAPMVQAAVKEAATRTALARVLAWPPGVVGHVTPEDLAHVLRTVGDRDDLVRKAIEALGDDAALQQLRQAAATAELQARDTAARLESAQQQLAQAERRAAALDEQLRSRASGAYEATEAQRRQLRIDGLRAAVDVLQALDAIDSDAGGLSGLREETLKAARRHGLVPIGRHGEQLAYDRTQHELVTGSAEPTTVTVVRAGYKYEDNETSVVLARALVTGA